MSEFENRIVRLGRVVEAKSTFDNKALNLSDLDSDSLTEKLRNAWDALVRQRIESSIRAAPELSPEYSTANFRWDETLPTVFQGPLNVVKFPDCVLSTPDEVVRLGMSATVCKGEKLSKIWVRCSEENPFDDETPETVRRLNEIGAVALEAISGFYRDCINEIADANDYNLSVRHIFQIEAADYRSGKLFDCLSTIRETASLYAVHQEGDWAPLSDLFQLTGARIRSAEELGAVAMRRDVFPVGIREITEYFNDERRALDWRVTMGRHGIFSIEEGPAQPDSDVGLTQAVGICARHVPPLDSEPRHSASWVVSGNMAPELGGYF